MSHSGTDLREFMVGKGEIPSTIGDTVLPEHNMNKGDVTMIELKNPVAHVRIR